jgi:hypothetical protein
MASKRQLPQFGVFQSNDEDIKQLTNDFPGILDRDYVDSMLIEIFRRAKIERGHRVSLAGMLEGQINSVTVVKKLLPAIYSWCLSNINGEDKWPALRQAYLILVRILLHLNHNMESALNEHLEQSITIGVHGNEEFGLTLSPILASLERKYRFQLKRGPKGINRDMRSRINSIYDAISAMLRPGFTGKMSKSQCCRDAIKRCNEQLEYTLNVDDIEDEMWRSRSCKEAAIRLTALCSGISESTVRRNIK